MTALMLQLDGLKKSYGGKSALRGIDLEVRDNEILALLGPTGAGKSSTLLASAGLVDLDGGRVRLDGVDVTDAEPSSRDVSIVFEGFNLLPVFNVRDNIAFALRSPKYREAEDEIERRVARTATLLRIDHLLDRDVETLSGGEKQRVAIARTLVRRPKIFLLDEPLSALDLKLREGLRAELRQIHREHHSTMLYATHDYHGAVALADRLAIINEGRILQCGTIADIYARPANAFVGRLIGSPSMAFFDARVTAGRVEAEGFTQDFALDDFGAHGRRDGDILLGVWPEEIEMSDAGAAGANPGKVYAVDNRGYESAVQIETRAGSFRKVLEQKSTVRQGDACSFRLTAASAYLFDAHSGDLVSHAKGEAVQ